MKPHALLLSVVLLAGLASAGERSSAAEASADRPNILFLFSDDHAVQAISAYPGGILDEVAPTPGIDRLAKEGLLFENSFCTNSICGPSRASILTGKHSHLNGYRDNNTSRFNGHQQTFPQLLQGTGYHTALVGKWHLGTTPVGFDYWEVLPGQGSYHNPDLIQMDGSKKRYKGHCNDIVTKLALEHLDKLAKGKKPFVMMAQYKAPHRSWCPAERHLTLFDDVTMPEPPTLFDDYANRSVTLKEHAMGIDEHMYWGWDMKFHGENQFPDHFMSGLPNREYDRLDEEQKKAWDAAYEPKNEKFISAMKAGELSDEAVVRWKYQRYIKDYLRSIRSMDEGIGEILDHLDKTGLAKNTIVIYSSDQGFYLGEHGWYDKRWMFEESFKMPLLIRWPGVIEPGKISQALVQNIDYAPTFLEICGLEIPGDMQGHSLVPLLKASGEAPEGWRESLYYRYYGESTHRVAAHDGVRTGDKKLMYFPDTKETNLFDLAKDPMEMKSVHDDPAYAEARKELETELDRLRGHYRVSTAVIPAHRNGEEWWKKRNNTKNQLARETQHDLLFIGDSITQGWEGKGKEAWEKFYGDRNALNLGFSGDRTEHVIWRLNTGNLRNQKNAKVAVVMIGTNNTGHSSQDPYATAEGVEQILFSLRAHCPDTKVLLLGVFPRARGTTAPKRLINISLNEQLRKFDDGERVHFLDISDAFLTPTGELPEEIMPDALHLSKKGYQIWAEAIEPKLKELGL